MTNTIFKRFRIAVLACVLPIQLFQVVAQELTDVISVKTSDVANYTATHKQWRFESVTYRIFNTVAGKYLTGHANGAVTLEPKDETSTAANQHWLIIEMPYDHIALRNKGTGLSGATNYRSDLQFVFSSGAEAQGSATLPVNLTTRDAPGSVFLKMNAATLIPVPGTSYTLNTIDWYTRSLIADELNAAVVAIDNNQSIAYAQWQFEEVESDPSYPVMSYNKRIFNTQSGKYLTAIFNPETEGPPITIPEGDVQVAVYYFPNWGPVSLSEWSVVKAAKPQFEGHQQPKVPVWGYQNENDPVVMTQKIDAASDNGIDAFIFDWYYYDEESSGLAGHARNWDGSKYLCQALENGFLKADNNDKLKFALMWCNHNLGGAAVKGAVRIETFEKLMDYVIETYFKHPSYWKIDGCPYFSIYQMNTLLETYDNDLTLLEGGINKFRDKVKAAGFPDLHLNAVLWGLKETFLDEGIRRLNINSTTSYVWIHHIALRDFPTTQYEKVAEAYFRALKSGGGANGLQTPVHTIPAPYHINATMGWDSSPRCRNSPDWMTRRGYPFGPVIVNNTPYLFKKYLAKAKELTMQNPESERIITINSWNEWGEGSYLEPEERTGYGYLNAIKEVFGN